MKSSSSATKHDRELDVLGAWCEAGEHLCLKVPRDTSGVPRSGKAQTRESTTAAPHTAPANFDASNRPAARRHTTASAAAAALGSTTPVHRTPSPHRRASATPRTFQECSSTPTRSLPPAHVAPSTTPRQASPGTSAPPNPAPRRPSSPLSRHAAPPTRRTEQPSALRPPAALAQRPGLNVLLREYVGLAQKQQQEQQQRQQQQRLSSSLPPGQRLKRNAAQALNMLLRPSTAVASKLQRAFDAMRKSSWQPLHVMLFLAVPWLWCLLAASRRVCHQLTRDSSEAVAAYCQPPTAQLLLVAAAVLPLLLAYVFLFCDFRFIKRLAPSRAPTVTTPTWAAALWKPLVRAAGGTGAEQGRRWKATPALSPAQAALFAATCPWATPPAPPTATSQELQDTLRRLESALLGKQRAPAADLAGRDLTSRVRSLCKQVGVTCPAGPSSSSGDGGSGSSGGDDPGALPNDVLSRLLAEVQKVAGV